MLNLSASLLICVLVALKSLFTEWFESFAELKPRIVDRYEEWYLAQMDDDGYTTPIGPTRLYVGCSKNLITE